MYVSAEGSKPVGTGLILLLMSMFLDTLSTGIPHYNHQHHHAYRGHLNNYV